MDTDRADTAQIASGLDRLGAFLRTERWRKAEAGGLSATQLSILGLVRLRGPLGVSAIARHLGVTQATASDSVAALARKGLVEQRRDAADARMRVVCPTPAGAELAANADDTPEALARAIGALPPGEAGPLARGLSRVIRTLQREGAIEPQRLCVTCRHFRPNVHEDAARPHHCALVDAAFGDARLRLDCVEHEAAEPDLAERNFRRFGAGSARE